MGGGFYRVYLTGREKEIRRFQLFINGTSGPKSPTQQLYFYFLISFVGVLGKSIFEMFSAVPFSDHSNMKQTFRMEMFGKQLAFLVTACEQGKLLGVSGGQR